MYDELRESLSLLSGRSEPWIWIAKPSESHMKKFICGGSAPAGALSVERPAEDALRRAVIFGSHPREPMVDKRRLADTGPGNDGNDVYLLV